MAGEVSVRIPDLPSGPRLPELNLVDKILSLPYVYCKAMVRYPGVWLLFVVLTLTIALPVAWVPLQVNTDLETFRRVDGNASRDFEVYWETLRHTRSVHNSSALLDREVFTVEILYEAKQSSYRDDSVFAEAVLHDIRNFEQRLRKLPGWVTLCDKVDPRARFLCEPGESLGNYVWPTRLDDFLGDPGFFRLNFDGLARERFSVPATLTYLSEGTSGAHNPSKFLPQTFAGPQSTSTLLRSVFSFTAPGLDASAFKAEYAAFATTELYAFLSEVSKNSTEEQDLDSWVDPLSMRMYFRGHELDEHEVSEALEHDMALAAAAFCFTFVVTWIHLESIFLAVVGMLTLCFSVLLAHVLLGFEKVSMVSCLVLFIVFGLGGNNFFKLNDLWHRVYKISPMAAPVERLMAYHRASLLQLMPVVSIALIFALFLLSLMRPLREFGFYMGACMLCKCFLSLVIFVPALVFNEQSVEPMYQRRLPPRLQSVVMPKMLRLPYPRIADLCTKLALRGKPIMIGVAVATLIGSISAIAVTATRGGDGLPQVFAPEHQRTAGQALVEAFEPSAFSGEETQLEVKMCEPWRAHTGLDNCGLHWCDTPIETRIAPEEGCQCYVADQERSKSCTELKVEAQLTGKPAGFSPEQWRSSLEDWIQAEQSGAAEREPESIEWSGEALTRPSLVFEHWESGATEIEALEQTAQARVLFASGVAGGSSCTERYFCFCGKQTCLAPTAHSEVERTIALPSRRLAADAPAPAAAAAAADAGPAAGPWRGLAAAPPVADGPVGELTAEVVVVFGIMPPVHGQLFDGVPSWSFDSYFEPQSPWSQRAMLSMCSDVPESLNVVAQDCWIYHFREWLLDQGQLFPVHRFGNFHDDLKRYLAASRGTSAQPASKMWFNDQGSMRATRLFMKVKAEANAKATRKSRQRWLDYVQERNDAAATGASNAWAASQAWVDAEAHDEALGSSWRVTGFTLLGIFASGLVYVRDLEMLAIIVGICAIAFSYLAFFMYCLFGWEFGPWELLLMCVFLTYSVEPAFRMTYDFVTPPSRKWRKDEVVAADFPPPALPPPKSEEGASSGDAGAANSEDQISQQSHLADAAPQDSMLVERGDTTAPQRDDNAGDMPASDMPASDIPEETYSEASGPGDPMDDEPLDALRRSLHHQSGAVIMGAIKICLCGWFMLPCKFRLFTRLGAVAIVVSGVQVVCTLVLLPACILLSRRTRREPDLYPISRFVYSKTSWIWT